jgi:hypothetical protein
MALWIVRSSGGIETDQEGHYDPVTVVARHQEQQNDKAVEVELIESTSSEAINFLRRQPHVLSIEEARDGEFEDHTEGTIVVSEGGTRWHPAQDRTGNNQTSKR